MDDAKCQESVQNWDGRLLVRILYLPHARSRCPLLRRVLVHWTAAHFFHGAIRAELWRRVAAVMVEERAGDVARCGEGEDFSLVDGRANDVGPSCCVVIHLGDILHRVFGSSA